MNPKNIKKNPWSYMNSLKIIQTFSPLSITFFLSFLSIYNHPFPFLPTLTLPPPFPTQDSNLTVLKSRNYARLQNVKK